MPRPKRCRKVCSMPRICKFLPSGEARGSITLSVDEYETVRLIDKQGFSQEECAAYMKIARTTAQQIYNSARHKLAKMLVEGAELRIEGGDYSLCSGEESLCNCGGCERHR